MSTTGETIAAKKLQAVNCSKCRYSCSATFTEENRQHIFAGYYGLSDCSRQKDFTAGHIVEVAPKVVHTHKLKVTASYPEPIICL